jgi:hypothetical protein
MKYFYRISPAIFFTLAVQICFCQPFLNYGLLLAIGSLLFRALFLSKLFIWKVFFVDYKRTRDLYFANKCTCHSKNWQVAHINKQIKLVTWNLSQKTCSFVASLNSPTYQGSGHYLWRGVAPKRKGLGKQNFEWVNGWVNEKQNNSRVG